MYTSSTGVSGRAWTSIRYGRPSPAISLARCSLPGSDRASGTSALERAPTPISRAGTCARRAIRSTTLWLTITRPSSSARLISALTGYSPRWITDGTAVSTNTWVVAAATCMSPEPTCGGKSPIRPVLIAAASRPTTALIARIASSRRRWVRDSGGRIRSGMRHLASPHQRAGTASTS